MTYHDPRIAVIGRGIAAGHHVSAIKQARGCSVAAVVPPAQEPADGEPVAEPAFDAVLRDDSIHAVALATGRPAYRVKLAEMALASGKAVVLERPAALTVADLDRIDKASKDHGLPVLVMHHHRYHVDLPEPGDLWPGDTVGVVEVSRIRADAYASSTRTMHEEDRTLAGALASVAIHYVDLACQLLGTPTAVTGIGDTDRRSGVQSRIVLGVEFMSGAMLAITSTLHSSVQSNRIMLHSSRGEWELREGILNSSAPPGHVSPQDLRARVYEELVRELRSPSGDPIPSLQRSRSIVWLLEQSNGRGRGVMSREELDVGVGARRVP